MRFLGASVDSISDDVKSRANIALIFIKPHAHNDAVKDLVERRITEGGLFVLQTGQLTGPEILSGSVIDKHYAAIAKSAMVTAPSDLIVSDQKKDEFNTLFGVTWDEALGANNVFNMAGSSEKLGVSGTELNEVWNKCTKSLKLAPGLYVKQLEEPSPPIFVINGFYGAMREKFIGDDVIVKFYVVGFDPTALSWASFRADFIGPTDVTVAPATSLRGTLFSDWSSLGLAAQPTFGDNGVHASAGPLEGLSERRVWCGADVKEDSYGARLLAAGVSESVLEAWLANSTVAVQGSAVGEPSFDATEDKSSTEVQEMLLAATAAASEATAAAAPDSAPAAAADAPAAAAAAADAPASSGEAPAASSGDAAGGEAGGDSKTG